MLRTKKLFYECVSNKSILFSRWLPCDFPPYRCSQWQLLLIYFKLSAVIYITSGKNTIDFQQHGSHWPLCKMRHRHCKAKFMEAYYSKSLSYTSIVFSSWILPHMRYCVKIIKIFCIHSHKNSVFWVVYHWQVLVGIIFKQHIRSQTYLVE